MKIVYQGTEVETGQTSVAGFLAERRVDVAKEIVEYAGEVYAPGADLVQGGLYSVGQHRWRGLDRPRHLSI